METPPPRTTLPTALLGLFAVAENYPENEGNENFLSRNRTSSTEDQLARAREIYNDAVMSFNTLIQVFPASLVAALGGFKSKTYYPVDEEAREPVKVSFT